MPPWILITPASRGIGLALARQLLRTTNLPIVATARADTEQVRERILSAQPPAGDSGDPQGAHETSTQNESTQKLNTEGDSERLHVLKLDVTDEDSIASAAQTCEQQFGRPDPKSKLSSSTTSSHLHLAFAIPGILHPEKAPSQIDAAAALDTFRMNAIGPMLLIKHFAPFLPRKGTPQPLLPSDSTSESLPQYATWAAMSARVGSISDNKMGGWYSYRASKAAVNQLVRSFDNYLRVSSGENAAAVALHPGTVKTGLSKQFWGNVKDEKLFTPEYAADRLVEVVAGMHDLEQYRGRCWDWKGEEVPP